MEKIFKLLPDSSVMNISKKERKKISRNSGKFKIKAFRSGAPYILDVDNKHRYISITGGFEGGLVIRAWPVDSNELLIAAYVENCGPVCSAEKLDFYRYNGKQFIPLSTNALLPFGENEFYLNTDTEKTMSENDIIATICYELPMEGNYILVHWGNAEDEVVYRNFGKGDCIEFTLEKGSFQKSPIYWFTNIEE